MKARIPKTEELVLLYQLDGKEENGKKVHGVLEHLGIGWREITGEMVSLPLGACAGLPEFQREAESDAHWTLPEGGALVMVGFTDSRMNALLAGLKQAGARVRFKAVMTQHNRNWPFGKLLGELGKEESVMRVLIPLRKRLSRAKALPPETLPETKRAALAAAVRRARMLAEGRTEVTEEAIRAADEALRQALGEPEN